MPIESDHAIVWGKVNEDYFRQIGIPEEKIHTIGTTQVIIKYSEAIEIDFSELKVFDSNGNQIDSRNTAYYEE